MIGIRSSLISFGGMGSKLREGEWRVVCLWSSRREWIVRGSAGDCKGWRRGFSVRGVREGKGVLSRVEEPKVDSEGPLVAVETWENLFDVVVKSESPQHKEDVMLILKVEVF